jgi:hypothetical protein
LRDLNPQRCIPNMKTIHSKLWSVASGNQTVSGGGGRRDQNQRWSKVSPTSSGIIIWIYFRETGCLGYKSMFVFLSILGKKIGQFIPNNIR